MAVGGTSGLNFYWMPLADVAAGLSPRKTSCRGPLILRTAMSYMSTTRTRIDKQSSEPSVDGRPNRVCMFTILTWLQYGVSHHNVIYRKRRSDANMSLLPWDIRRIRPMSFLFVIHPISCCPDDSVVEYYSIHSTSTPTK